MKSAVAKLTFVALVAAPLVSQAQNLFPQNDSRANLTLLPGPTLLSPANATGVVVPGQMWKAKTTGFLMLNPPTQARSFAVAGVGAFSRQLSSPALTVGVGTLTFRAAAGPITLKPWAGTITLSGSNGPPAQKPDSVPRATPAAKPVNPDSLQFDAQLPKLEISPLQKKPATRGEFF
jgi:hypothetical protein